MKLLLHCVDRKDLSSGRLVDDGNCGGQRVIVERQVNVGAAHWGQCWRFCGYGPEIPIDSPSFIPSILLYVTRDHHRFSKQPVP